MVTPGATVLDIIEDQGGTVDQFNGEGGGQTLAGLATEGFA